MAITNDGESYINVKIKSGQNNRDFIIYSLQNLQQKINVRSLFIFS